jgi:hypothetical protein
MATNRRVALFALRAAPNDCAFRIRPERCLWKGTAENEQNDWNREPGHSHGINQDFFGVMMSGFWHRWSAQCKKEFRPSEMLPVESVNQSDYSKRKRAEEHKKPTEQLSNDTISGNRVAGLLERWALAFR